MKIVDFQNLIPVVINYEYTLDVLLLTHRQIINFDVKSSKNVQ